MIDGGINLGQLLAVIVSIGSLLMTFYFNNKSIRDRRNTENSSMIEREKREAVVNERIINSVKGVKSELEAFKCENKTLIDSYKNENKQLISDFKDEINKKLDKSNEDFNKKLDKSNEDLNKRFEDLSKELKAQQEITTKIREENVETKSSAKSAHKRLDDIVKLIGKREDI